MALQEKAACCNNRHHFFTHRRYYPSQYLIFEYVRGQYLLVTRSDSGCIPVYYPVPAVRSPEKDPEPGTLLASAHPDRGNLLSLHITPALGQYDRQYNSVFPHGIPINTFAVLTFFPFFDRGDNTTSTWFILTIASFAGIICMAYMVLSGGEMRIGSSWPHFGTRVPFFDRGYRGFTHQKPGAAGRDVPV